MLQLYLYEALDKVKKAAKDTIASFTTGIEKRTLNFLVGRLLKKYNQNPKQLTREVADYALAKEEYPF